MNQIVIIEADKLEGVALQWAVATAAGYSPADLDLLFDAKSYEAFDPVNNWRHAEVIFDKNISKVYRNVGGTWSAQVKTETSYFSPTYMADIKASSLITAAGKTMLLAAMRAFVKKQRGNLVSVPQEFVFAKELDDAERTKTGV